jgi:double-stranded uracil-DNA glycosylase
MRPMGTARPADTHRVGFTAEQLEAARSRLLPDVLPGPDDPPLRVLFCGINPGLLSAATGHHFARPGNRFWPALHAAGFTPRRFAPAEQHLLPGLGLGITNVAPRATARADELDHAELVAGGERLRALVAQVRPAWLAVVGIGAYRVAFAERKAAAGRQERTLGPTGLWVLPNPSGLNAHHTPASLAAAFAALREAVDGSG